MSDTNETKEDKLDNLLKGYNKKRKDISLEIRNNIELMHNMKNLKEVQVMMLSMRQRLLEDSHVLMENLLAVKKKYRSERAKQMENISNNIQTRYQYTEKTVLIDGQTSNIKEVSDAIENQISFFVDSIKTIDSVLYGIKTRVEIDKTLGMQ